MRPLIRLASGLAVAVIAMTYATLPAGAADYHRHHVHRHAGTRVAPAYAPPPPVSGGLGSLPGPLIPGYTTGGGVLGTGLSDGTGLLGIGFLGL